MDSDKNSISNSLEPQPSSPPHPIQDANPPCIVPPKKRYVVPLKKRYGMRCVGASTSAPVEEANTNSSERATSTPVENNSGEHEVSCHYAYSMTKRLVLSDEQRRKAQELVRQVQVSNPAFLQVLKRSHLMINAGVAIPRRFCDENLPKESQDILLCRFMEEKTWSAWYYHYGERQRTISHAGWAEFVRDNNLKLGDICLFELDKSANQVKFIVHVSPAA